MVSYDRPPLCVLGAGACGDGVACEEVGVTVTVVIAPGLIMDVIEVGPISLGAAAPVA